MVGGHSISLDERFFRWLADQIQRTQQGSIHLEIERGQIRYVGCHGHRYLYSLDEAQEPAS